MRLLLAPGIFPPDSGGPATFVPEIADTLVDRGHDIKVVTNGTVEPGFDCNFPFDVVRISRDNTVPVRYANRTLTVTREILRFNPDVILANGFDLPTIPVARLLGVPVVTKVVGDIAWERSRRAGLSDDIETFQERRYGSKITALKAIRTAQTRLADHVIVPSHYLKRIVTGWGVPEDNVTVIYNALDIDPPEVPLEHRVFRIVTVCRLVDWKGVDGLIRAFASIAGTFNDLELHVVGDGEQREQLETQAEETGFGDRIVFHGKVRHEQVIDILAHSRIFALNSTYEGLPHVAIEAIACGTPVVLSDAGGNPEVVSNGDSGFIVPQGGITAFTNKFDALLSNDNLWREFNQRSLIRQSKQFDYDDMIEQYVALLKMEDGSRISS